MRHALVVGGSALVGFAVEQHLVGHGFGAVDMVSDLADAIRLADDEHFDLVIVLSSPRQAPGAELLSAADRFDAPVLVAGDDPLKALGCLVAEPALPQSEARELETGQLAV